jgi:two-component system, OmpR family, response regulator
VRILIVEDDKTQGAAITRQLAEAHFTCDWVRTVVDGSNAMRAYSYELVILDRQLPDGDGLELVQEAKAGNLQLRYLILSTKSDSSARAFGLTAGADDYLPKPFDPDELLARVRALLRRSKVAQPGILKLGHIALNHQESHVICGGKTLLLPRKEYLILETLMLRAERVTTRQALEETVYNMDEEVESNTLDAQISRLRKRLRDHDSGLNIVALRGIGYLLTVEVEQREAVL